MTELKIFNSEQFGAIRIMIDPETKSVMFCAKDVAKALGYATPQKAICDHCKGCSEIVTPTPGGPQKMRYIPEPDVYRLVMASKLPDAERFQDWVCEEVLPQIRQTGGYIPMSMGDNEMTIMAKALEIANRTLAMQRDLIEEQYQQMANDEPLVRFAHQIEGSESSISMGEMAKLLAMDGHDIGRQRFFDWMRDHGYIFKQSTEPIQKWVEKGILELSISLVDLPNGKQREVVTTKVTGKGQRYLLELFRKGHQDPPTPLVRGDKGVTFA